jgi:hypothetical protein
LAIVGTLSNHFKYQLAKKEIDLASDTNIKVLLMRSGFTFNKDNHAKKINVINTQTDTSYAITGAYALTDSDSQFIVDGFVPGMSVTISGFTETGNACTKIISTVAAGTIVFTSTAGLVEESEGDSVTLVGNDELADGSGYDQDTKLLTTQVLAEDDTNDRAALTADDIVWTASGGDIGPTPGALFYDDDSTDDTIIGYLSFGANTTAGDGGTFTISAPTIRLT